MSQVNLNITAAPAYSYDPETMAYTGQKVCQLDPLETQAKGELVWLTPANATRTAPPAPKRGFARVYVPASDSWDYKEDHRGTEYWLPAEGDNWQSSPRIMQELGPLPEGAVAERPARPEEDILREKWEMLRAARNYRLTETDYLLMPDYPISETAREAVKTYRQALRDLPEQEGAPWDGGGSETPWPVKPEV